MYPKRAVGHFARADELLVRSIAGSHETGYTIGEGYALTARGFIAVDCGELERARVFVERGIALAADSNDPKLLDGLCMLRGSVLMRQGSIDEGMAELHAVIERRGTIDGSNFRSEELCLLLDAQVRTGNRDSVRAIATELRQLAERDAHEVKHPVQVVRRARQGGTARGRRVGSAARSKWVSAL